MRILLVDDNAILTHILGQTLNQAGYTVNVAGSGGEAGALIDQAHDLVILDRQLPDVDGLSICRMLRTKQRDTPILMLTASEATGQRVEGLDAGADDYVVKPFHVPELLARIRTLLRRPARRTAMLQVADLTVDTETRSVIRGGMAIDLTQREYDLLVYLMRHAGQPVNRTTLAEQVWERHDSPDSNVVDVYVAHLRRKIERGQAERVISTVRGVGYMVCPPCSQNISA